MLSRSCVHEVEICPNIPTLVQDCGVMQGKTFWLGSSVYTSELRRTMQLPFTCLTSDTGAIYPSRLFARNFWEEKE